MANLDTKIKKDNSSMQEHLKHVKWFHGNINRKIAEVRLKKDGKKKDGAFLVRESAADKRDFVLSLMKDKKFAHFIISHRRALHCLYSIDNGPMKTGLEELIEYYKKNNSHLPTRLLHPLKLDVPPPLSLKRGYTNILHIAIQQGDVGLAIRLLEHVNCPNVDIKNDRGSLALHQAASKGYCDIVSKLISKGAEVSAPDEDGNSALHCAVMYNHESVVRCLIEEGRVSVHTRNHENGNMPLHEAAARGHQACVELLLSYGACAWPLNIENITPYEFANQHQHLAIAKIIDTYKPRAAQTLKSDWFHAGIKREEAQALITRYGCTDGMFLVRDSSRSNTAYVLQVAYKNSQTSFQVFLLQNKDLQMYHIDAGPLFSSIEHLVEFYCLCADGLSTNLTTAILPGGGTKPILLTRVMQQIFMESTMSPVVQENGFTEYMSAAEFNVHGELVRSSSAPKTIGPSPSQTMTLLRQKFKEHLLQKDNINEEYELGQGEFGSVLKGTWVSPCGAKIDVAIKTLHEEYHTTGKASFLAEAEVMVELNHPCIVHLIGVCLGPPLMLVQELVELGSLLDFLLDYPEKIDVQRDMYLWAAQVACGMLYLETQHFVHRDLATRNILLVSKAQAKVGDFGLSRCLDSEQEFYKATKGGRWPVRWYAPEAINYGKFSHASDVWSFGVTLWEMFTYGDQPYEDMNGAQVVSFIEKGGRLTKPDICPDHVYKIMRSCWQYEPQNRVTFKKLLEEFNAECAKIGQHLINPAGASHGSSC